MLYTPNVVAIISKISCHRVEKQEGSLQSTQSFLENLLMIVTYNRLTRIDIGVYIDSTSNKGIQVSKQFSTFDSLLYVL